MQQIRVLVLHADKTKKARYEYRAFCTIQMIGFPFFLRRHWRRRSPVLRYGLRKGKQSGVVSRPHKNISGRFVTCIKTSIRSIDNIQGEAEIARHRLVFVQVCRGDGFALWQLYVCCKRTIIWLSWLPFVFQCPMKTNMIFSIPKYIAIIY